MKLPALQFRELLGCEPQSDCTLATRDPKFQQVSVFAQWANSPSLMHIDDLVRPFKGEAQRQLVGRTFLTEADMPATLPRKAHHHDMFASSEHCALAKEGSHSLKSVGVKKAKANRYFSTPLQVVALDQEAA